MDELLLTENQMRERIAAYVAENKLTPASHLLKVSVGNLSDVVNGRRPISACLAEKFGAVRRYVYAVPVPAVSQIESVQVISPDNCLPDGSLSASTRKRLEAQGAVASQDDEKVEA